LENPDPGNGDYFGGELEIVGDTVWVGSLFDDTVAPDAGAVYIFDVSTGELLQTLHSPHPSSDGVFGIPILTAGNDVLIGAHGDNADGIPGGAVYRYDAASRELLATY
jgi:outer membrane protein assembly factor BamB